MNAKQTIHKYMLSAVKKSDKKIQVKCTTIKSGKEVYSAIFEAYPTYGTHIEKVKSGINYKDFTLKFDAKWAASELHQILLNIKADTSLKVEEPAPTNTDAFDDPTNPAPTNTNTNTGAGNSNVFYSAPGADALNRTTNASGSSSKMLIIAGAAVVVLVTVLLLLKKRK